MQMIKENMRRRERKGFTLVEVLIVVVILGILAATVLPQFTSATKDAKESAVVQDLQMLRQQINMYKFQHDGKLPGTATGVTFEQAMMNKTDIDGTLNATSGKFGPYLVGQLPPNPYNGKSDVKVVSADLAETDVDGTTGWIYSDTTGDIRCNFDDTLVSDDTKKLFSL